MWDDLQHRWNEGKGIRIRGIWIADMSNQGASGQLNEGNMGNERKQTGLQHRDHS